jgi:acyl dehydratase
MNGLHFEELEEGQLFDHPIRRTVTEMDNTLFSALTYNPQPLHIDRHFCATETEFGQPLMNSYFTLGLMVGIAVNDMSLGTTVANLGMTEVKFPAPVFHGDTLHVRTTVLGKRESKSRPEAGIIELKHEAYNQDDTLVATCTRQVLTRRKRAD